MSDSPDGGFPAEISSPKAVEGEAAFFMVSGFFSLLKIVVFRLDLGQSDEGSFHRNARRRNRLL